MGEADATQTFSPAGLQPEGGGMAGVGAELSLEPQF